MLRPTYAANDNIVSGSLTGGGGKSVSFKSHPSGDVSSNKRNALLGAPLPAPLLLSRSHCSIELLPYLFSAPSPVSRAEESRNGLAVAAVVAQTALSASNATSTTTAVSVDRPGRGKAVRKTPRIAKVRVSHAILPSLWLGFLKIRVVCHNSHVYSRTVVFLLSQPEPSTYQDMGTTGVHHTARISLVKTLRGFPSIGHQDMKKAEPD